MVPCVSERTRVPAWKSKVVKKLQEQGGVATIPCSPTEVSILQRPGTIKGGYHSMLNNPGEHSAASYFKDNLYFTDNFHRFLVSAHALLWSLSSEICYSLILALNCACLLQLASYLCIVKISANF